MDISIIIINYNTFTLTSNCIRSIIEFTLNVSYEIILVDNASTECDPEEFLKKFPNVVLIKSMINGGFAYGNNLGIQQARGEYILLLNSDTILIENSILSSLQWVSNYENAGVLGCRMIYPDGKIQHTARRFRTINWELLDLFRFIPLLMPYKKRARIMLGRYFNCDENIECDWVNGAYFLFEKKIVQRLPGKKLDDRFFMYGEDQLWCEQIKALGYRNVFYAGTTIVHLSMGSTDAKKKLLLQRTVIKNELAIMRLRQGENFYYYCFTIIFFVKQSLQYILKFLRLKFRRPPIKSIHVLNNTRP